MNVIDILPKHVYQFHYVNPQEFEDYADQMNIHIHEYYQNINPDYPKSQIVEQDEIPSKLLEFIFESFEEMMFDMRIKYADFDLKLIWFNSHSNRTISGHKFHTHQNSLFSGVYYFSTVANDQITFRDPDVNFTRYNDIFRIDETQFNVIEHDISVNDGDLLFFRSDYQHGVKDFTTIDFEKRISMAFNIDLKGIGSKKRLTCG